MNASNMELVKQSWFLIAQMDNKVLGRLFYTRLFKIAPEVKPLFKGVAMAVQSDKLLSMLSYIITNLDRLDQIAAEVAELAKRHVQYGVKNEHYLAVGKALMWALKQGFGKYWEDEFTVAWTEVYTVISDAMIQASFQD